MPSSRAASCWPRCTPVEGRVHVDDWMGRGVSITAVLRDPDDLVARFERAGFTVTDRHLRPAYPDEHPTDRFYLVGVGYS